MKYMYIYIVVVFIVMTDCYMYDLVQITPKPQVPIVHFMQAKPPFILCVKWVSSRVYTPLA